MNDKLKATVLCLLVIAALIAASAWTPIRHPGYRGKNIVSPYPSPEIAPYPIIEPTRVFPVGTRVWKPVGEPEAKPKTKPDHSEDTKTKAEILPTSMPSD